MEKQKLSNILDEKINKIQEVIDGRSEVIDKLIKDGLKEIEIRDELIKLKNEIESENHLNE
ncbi:hypothetical protein QI211_04180 [Staphylococcus saprophyticus]|nr:hypothetical protein [Staphylococcus saprophyticus]